MSTTARYFHASLYAFKPTARTRVIEEFHSTIGNDVEVKCWYDAAQDSFALECPNALGSQADAALAEVLSRYIERNAEAEDEEGRETSIRRFSESKFESLDSIANATEADEEDDEQEKARPMQIQRRADFTHLVICDGDKSRDLMFLPLHVLPAQLLERTLAHPSKNMEKLFGAGFTCRVVRSHGIKKYIFNGRTGIGQASPPNAHLQLPAFAELCDGRDASTISGDRPPRDMPAIVGRPPTLQAWLDGVGQTRQVSAEQTAEMPKDTIKLLAAGTGNGVGRLRVVKGQQILPDDSGEELDKGEERAGPPTSFADLLSGNVDAGTDGLHDDPDEDDAHEDDETPSAPFSSLFSQRENVQPFNKELRLGHNAVNPQPSINEVQGPSPSQRSASALHNELGPSANHVNVTSQDEEASTREAFPTYGSQFAKVDDIGLTANAGPTAQWEDSHHYLKQRKRRRGPLTSRSVTTASHVGSRTASSADSPSRKTGNSGRDSAQLNSARPPSWATNVPPAWVGAENAILIDDTGPDSSEAQTDSRLQRAWPERHTAWDEQGTSTSSAGKSREPDGEDLILLSPRIPATDVNVRDCDQPLQDLSRQAGDAQSAPEYSSASTVSSTFIETVKTLPPDYAAKKHTMRQKARAKRRNQNTQGKQKISTAGLPQLSPPPPPKPKKEDEEGKITRARPRKQPSNSNSHTSLTAPGTQEAGLDSITNAAHIFGKRLLEAKDAREVFDEDGEPVTPKEIKLVGQIAMLLTRSADQTITQKIRDTKAVRKKLNDPANVFKTDSFSRLTTSVADAAHLMNMGSLSETQFHAHATYEIIIRDTAGNVAKVTVPGSNKMAHVVKQFDQVVSEAYAHYPIYVWDARYLLMQPGQERKSSSTDMIEDFVLSMQTDGTAPSFKAMSQPGHFTVEKVLARQEFSQTQDELIFKVTLVRDLVVESVNDGRYNLRAVALSDEEMVDHQRLWWSANYETSDLDKAEQLQEKVDKLVRSIDGVGLENRGPYLSYEPNSEDEAEEESSGPVPDENGVFW